MVHRPKMPKKKPELGDFLDDWVKDIGWNIKEITKNEKDYLLENKKVKFVKTDAGYKIIMFRDNELYGSDITQNKKMATTLLGEVLMFKSW